MKHELSQYEFESAMYRILAFGDQQLLADASGKSGAYYSQMLNPEDARESTWYRTAQDFFNLIHANEERGCKALQTFVSFVNRAMPGETVCIDTARRKALDEHHDWVVAEAENKPVQDRITELEQSIAAKQKTLDGLRAERKREILETEFKGTVTDIRKGRAA